MDVCERVWVILPVSVCECMCGCVCVWGGALLRLMSLGQCFYGCVCKNVGSTMSVCVVGGGCTSSANDSESELLWMCVQECV